MPQCVYVDCLSTKKLLRALGESPYITQVRLVPKLNLLPLLQYLQDPKTPPAKQWVHLKVHGAYKNQVGVIAENSSVLAKHIHKRLPGNPPMLIIPVHPEDTDVEHCKSLYAFMLKKGSFEVFNLVIDQKFIDSVSWLLVSETAHHAWYMLWHCSWLDGCIVQLKGTSCQAAIVCMDVEDIMLSRVYSVRTELVIIFVSYAGQVVHVIEQVNKGELEILLLK